MPGTWIFRYMHHSKYIKNMLIVIIGFLLFGILTFFLQKHEISIGIDKDITLGIILAVSLLLLSINYFKNKKI